MNIIEDRRRPVSVHCHYEIFVTAFGMRALRSAKSASIQSSIIDNMDRTVDNNKHLVAICTGVLCPLQIGTA